jgi:hypothetical protein
MATIVTLICAIAWTVTTAVIGLSPYYRKDVPGGLVFTTGAISAAMWFGLWMMQ